VLRLASEGRLRVVEMGRDGHVTLLGLEIVEPAAADGS
jgi:hypothetical protein